MLAIRKKILKKIMANPAIVEEMNRAKSWRDVQLIIVREAKKLENKNACKVSILQMLHEEQKSS